ncbi:MAG: DUF3299 domain-containing protein [Aureliella sp.]
MMKASLIVCLAVSFLALPPGQDDSNKDKKEEPKAKSPVSEKSTAGSRAAARSKAADTKQPELSPAEKAARLAARRRGELVFDDLKFDIEKGGKFERKMLTKDIESFNKRTIRIRGYMYPTFQQEGITEFVLVRDNQECCFGPGAAIFDCIRIKMAKGKSTKFSVRPIAVKGKFEIEEFRMPDGMLAAIYKITATDVR